MVRGVYRFGVLAAVLVLASSRGVRAEPAGDTQADGIGAVERQFREAHAAYERGEYGTALVLLESAYERFPDDALLFDIANVKLMLGRCREARENLEDFLSRPQSPEPQGRAEASLKHARRCENETSEPHVSATQPTRSGVDSNAYPRAAREKARQAFERGVAAFREGALELSRIEFTKAYELVPDYRVLYNIGQVNHELHAYAHALRALYRYLSSGGDAISEERRRAVEATIKKLEGRTARLTLRANVPDATVSVAGENIGKTPLSRILVDAGRQRVALEKAGYSRVERVLTLAGGEDVTLDVVLLPLGPARSEAPKPASSPLWIGWATTSVLAASALTTGTLMLRKIRDIDDLERQQGVSVAEARRLQREAHGFALATDVLGGLALASGAVSLYFTLTAPKAASSTPVGLVIRPQSLELNAAF